MKKVAAKLSIPTGEKFGQKAQPQSLEIKPVKALSPFLQFSKAQGEQIKSLILKKQPNLTPQQLKEFISETWRSLTEDQRQIYTALAEKDKRRFEKETNQLAKNGWFTNEDGIRNTTLMKEQMKKKSQAEKEKTQEKEMAGKAKAKAKVQEDKEKERKKKEDDMTVKPKQKSSCYMQFAISRQRELREQTGMKPTDLAKQIGEEWQNLTEAQKKPFDALAKKDAVRYEKEMKQLETHGYFVNKDGVKSTDLLKNGKVREYPEGSLMPKKPQAGYFQFISEQRAIVVKKNPEAKITEIAKMLGEMWTKLTEVKKKPFNQKYEQDKDRYQTQLEQLKKFGYFILEDGSKSTEEKNAHLLKPEKILQKRKAPKPVEELEAQTKKVAGKKSKKE